MTQRIPGALSGARVTAMVPSQHSYLEQAVVAPWAPPPAGHHGPYRDGPRQAERLPYVDGEAVLAGCAGVPRRTWALVALIRREYRAHGRGMPWQRVARTLRERRGKLLFGLFFAYAHYEPFPRLAWCLFLFWLLRVRRFVWRHTLLVLLDDPLIFPDVPRTETPYED